MSDKTTTILGVAGAALTAYRFVAVDGTDNERLDPCGDGARAGRCGRRVRRRW